MKILDRGYISNTIPFAGVMLIEGEKVNDYLRSIENPQHTKWEPERIEPKDMVPQAKAYVKGLYDYIKDCLEKLKQENPSDEIDPDIGEFLPDEPDLSIEIDRYKKETETLQDSINSVVTSEKPNIRIIDRKMDDKGDSESIDDSTYDNESDLVSGSGHKNGKKGNNGEGTGENDGQGQGGNAADVHKEMSTILTKKIRVLCKNKSTGEYLMTYIPKSSAENGKLVLFLSAESQNYPAPILSVTCNTQTEITIVGNQICGFVFEENTPITMMIKLDYYEYCSMEVKAYGYSV
jgi:hypothetical protein